MVITKAWFEIPLKEEQKRVTDALKKLGVKKSYPIIAQETRQKRLSNKA